MIANLFPIFLYHRHFLPLSSFTIQCRTSTTTNGVNDIKWKLHFTSFSPVPSCSSVFTSSSSPSLHLHHVFPFIHNVLIVTKPFLTLLISPRAFFEYKIVKRFRRRRRKVACVTCTLEMSDSAYWCFADSKCPHRRIN